MTDLELERIEQSIKMPINHDAWKHVDPLQVGHLYTALNDRRELYAEVMHLRKQTIAPRFIVHRFDGDGRVFKFDTWTGATWQMMTGSRGEESNATWWTRIDEEVS